MCNFRMLSIVDVLLVFLPSVILVMATLQLPATNLANLANLPPGTKLYLTTNSKNPSGKGKLLLIPQGAILRATNNASECIIPSFSPWVSTWVRLVQLRAILS